MRCSRIERIPVLGRTGPDLTINELGLVVDVKSRLQVPENFLLTWPTVHGCLLTIPLNLLEAVVIDGILLNESATIGGKVSVIVGRYFAHMHEWAQKHRPDGITALVLHKPKRPFGLA